ncbi:hypothetical protein CRYUN_Cryun34aG0082700 [Craigia yunnanensis]
MSQIMELIPGLPNDIARECLIRVPYDNFSNIASTCKDWKVEIHLPQIVRHRQPAGCTKHVMVMIQTQVNLNKNSAMKCQAMPVYRIVLCEPNSDDWCELPLVPGLSDGLPMFCQVVGVGPNLVVMGGFDPDTFEVRNAVYVYYFLSATWRRGAECQLTENYTCRGGDVATLEGDTWEAVAELPAEVYNTAHVATWQDKLLVIGSPSFVRLLSGAVNWFKSSSGLLVFSAVIFVHYFTPHRLRKRAFRLALRKPGTMNDTPGFLVNCISSNRPEQNHVPGAMACKWH